MSKGSQSAGLLLPETSNRRPARNADIVARKATEKASVRRSVLMQINLNPARLDKETSKARTMKKDQKDLEPRRPVKVEPL